MSRYSQTQTDHVWFPVTILIGSVLWTHRTHLVHITYTVVGIVSCLILTKLLWAAARRHRSIRLQDIDSMDGLVFERYVAILLQANGFRKVRLTERYDYGVDIVAEKNGMRWGIQAKRRHGIVKADAIRQVVTGLKMYGCDKAMVVTNSSYSTVARRLAYANGCILVDRARLKDLTEQRSIL